MTFLNPLVLFGLAAAAIPVILHLLNLRKVRTIEFSSLRFLKELQRTRMRRIRIRQILLLVLRTLLVIALVLAFSRPTVRTTLAGAFTGRATTTMAIILDDSPSMAVRNAKGVLFAQAKEAASRIVNIGTEGDRYLLLPLSQVGRAASLPPARSRDDVVKALEQAQISQVTVPYRQALRAAVAAVNTIQGANREVYLITDGQATQFASTHTLDDSTIAVDPQTRFFVVNVQQEQTDNSGVLSAAVVSRMITPQRPVQIRALIRHFGSAASGNTVAGIALEGARVYQQSLDLRPAGTDPTASATVNASVTPKHRGILGGYVQIEDDALEADNTRFFTLRVPENVKVLLVGGKADDTRLLSLALTAGGDSSLTGIFTVRQTTEAQLATIDLLGFDVIILSDVHDFSNAEAERIAQFVRGGHGLLVFPGPGINVANVNSTLLADLGIPPAGAPPVDHPDRNSFISFDHIDLDHPLFTGLFESAPGRRRGQVESPHVYGALPIRPGAAGSSIITLTGGGIFLAEYPVSDGRVLLYAVDAGFAWSDFPLKGLFAPLLHRSVVYLSAERDTMPSFTTGEPLQFVARVPAPTAQDQFVLRSPSGIEEKLIPTYFPSSRLASFDASPATETGIYNLYRTRGGTGSGAVTGRQSKPITAVAVNLDPTESDTRQIEAEALQAFFVDAGIPAAQLHPLAAQEELPETIQRSRAGIELWKHFLVIAVLLALAEMALARSGKREQEAA